MNHAAVRGSTLERAGLEGKRKRARSDTALSRRLHKPGIKARQSGGSCHLEVDGSHTADAHLDATASRDCTGLDDEGRVPQRVSEQRLWRPRSGVQLDRKSV